MNSLHISYFGIVIIKGCIVFHKKVLILKGFKD